MLPDVLPGEQTFVNFYIQRTANSATILRFLDSATEAASIMNHVDSVKQSWRQGIEPDLRSLLPVDTNQGGGDATRNDQIVEAICEDMRWRWSSDGTEKKKTDDYLRQLGDDFNLADQNALVRLAACEWEIRSRRGDDGVLPELQQRYPSVAVKLVHAITSSEWFQKLSDTDRDVIFRTIGDEDEAFQTVDPAATQTHDPKSDGALSTVASGKPDFESRSAAKPFRSISDDAKNITKLGRYQVVRKLGSGAFGDVYLGFDDKLNRHVAIKAPRRQWLERTGDVESFLAEARAAAGLNHPGIVTTHDIVEEADGTILIVMEYIEGGNLQDLIDQQSDGRSMVQKLGETFIASIGYQTALALAEAHHHGLIHRDLKPANLMIKNDQIRITDFGLAVKAKDTAGQRRLAGTPAYMSPEQIEANADGLDARSDIWSVGVILYQLSTRELPFAGNVQEIFQKIKETPPRRPRSIDKKIPERLESIILRCLEKDRRDRFENVLQLADELRPLAAQKIPGFRWEWLVLPAGIILSMLGTIVGLSYTTMLIMFEPFFSTSDLINYGIESFVFVALTLGIGPPLVALGNWFCCRRCKALSANAPNIPCRVSRWAIGCLAAGSASAGFGFPMYVIAIVLGIVASVSIRRKKRWITGYRHITAGLVLGAILLIPSLFFWWSFGGVYRTVAEREMFDRALAADELSVAESSIARLKQLAETFPVSQKGGDRWALIYEARLRLAENDHEAAIELTNQASDGFFLNNNTRACAQIVRATAYLRTGMEMELNLEKGGISTSLYPVPPRLPLWAETMLDDLGPIEPPDDISLWGTPDEAEEAAPLPPAPLIDPSA